MDIVIDHFVSIGYISIECYEIYDPNDQIADESIMSVENGLSIQHAKVSISIDDLDWWQSVVLDINMAVILVSFHRLIISKQ